MKDDLVFLRKQYQDPMSLSENKNNARVVIIRELGVVPSMQSWKQSLPISDSRGRTVIYSLALPFYSQYGASNSMMPKLTLNDVSVHDELITNVSHMAKYALKERIVNTLFRQVMRLVIKEQLRKKVGKENQLAGLVLNVWNSLTEQPDTRSWLSLPAEISTVQQDVIPGKQTIHVGSSNYNFNIKKGHTVLVWISQQGSKAVIWHKQLGKL